MTWLPTSENINILDEPVRKYIADLETNCDPAGIIRENTITVDMLNQLQAKLAESEAKVKELEGMLEISERNGKRAAEWGIATKEHLFAAQAELVELRKNTLDYDYDAHLERYGATTKNPQERDARNKVLDEENEDVLHNTE